MGSAMVVPIFFIGHLLGVFFFILIGALGASGLKWQLAWGGVCFSCDGACLTRAVKTTEGFARLPKV